MAQPPGSVILPLRDPHKGQPEPLWGPQTFAGHLTRHSKSTACSKAVSLALGNLPGFADPGAGCRVLPDADGSMGCP